MSDIHASIRAFLQQQTIIPLPPGEGGRQRRPGEGPHPPRGARHPLPEGEGYYNKAGVVPFLRGEEGFRFYLMKPRSTVPELGIPPFQICKGTRQYFLEGTGWHDMKEGMDVAGKETLPETAMREGIEELGLKLDNIVRLFDLGGFGFYSATTGKAKQMWLYAAEIESEDDFLHEREVALTTEERRWFSLEEFAALGREDHRIILKDIEARLLAHWKE